MPTTATITIQGMTCTGCTQSLEKTLRDTPGVLTAHVNLTPPAARVQFDPSTTGLPKLLQSINSTKFRATQFTIDAGTAGAGS